MITRRTVLQAGMGWLPWLPPLTMQLDWRLNAQFAGLCVADARGDYRRQGIRVNIKAAPPDLDVVPAVLAQPHTLGCAEESLILTAQAQGMAVVAIATMLQASPLSLMALPTTPLNNLQQLIGKRIGVHSDGQKALELVLHQHHIDPQQLDIVDIPYRHKHQRLTSGEFDAVQCYALDEPIKLAQQLGRPPTVLSLKDYGFDAYSQVIFAPTSLVADSPHVIHRFLKASFSGWRWAMEHPAQTAQLLVDRYVAPDYQSLTYQTQSLGIIAQYVQPNNSNRAAIGTIDPDRWQHSAQQLAQARLIEALPPLDTSIDLSLWL